MEPIMLLMPLTNCSVSGSGMALLFARYCLKGSTPMVNPAGRTTGSGAIRLIWDSMERKKGLAKAKTKWE